MTNPDILDTDVTRPPIVLCRSDHQRLTRLAMERLLSMPREAGALLQEVHRATIVADDEIASDVIGLGSGVAFRTDDGGPERRVVLVLETQPEATGDEVAVLSNLGAGLIGLSKGQTIRWADRVGGMRELTIVDVLPRAPSPVETPKDALRASPGELQPEALGEVVPFRRSLRSAGPEGEEPPPSAA